MVVLSGIDPKTKAFTEPKVVIEKANPILDAAHRRIERGAEGGSSDIGLEHRLCSAPW
jgi:hypothetical protein